MNDSYIQHHTSGGTTLAGPDAVNLYRAMVLRSSIRLYEKTGMIPTRGLTITKMFMMAKQYTGKMYKRGQYALVLSDLQTWIDTMKAAMPVIDSKGEQK